MAGETVPASAVVNKQGFYGMSKDGVDAYITAIRTNCITEAKTALTEKMESILFAAVRKGWVGQAEKNFETNMSNLITKTGEALENAQKALEQELGLLVQQWVEQDQNVVSVWEE